MTDYETRPQIKPLHPKAKEFFTSGLFSNLNKFEELEARISSLGDDKQKGDAFEVFAETYLVTQRKNDAAQVWPLASVPLDILNKLNIPIKDYGVDGIFKTQLGGLSAYQVKYRSKRPTLTWTELSTFLGHADSTSIQCRVLITNSDDLPPLLIGKERFFCIRGSDLDRLEAKDFQAIEAWLAGSAFILPRKMPLPHQVEALSKLLPAFNESNRISAIMACGTGKTLVALWVAEQLRASKIIVLLPSLALIRQSLHEWLHETSLPALTYLCVCSDPTVKEDPDSLVTNQSDLDFEVTTVAQNVRNFLDCPFDGVKVVFSTYQSSHVIGDAMNPYESFDFGVFDEAHKTAGREGRSYAFALDDAHLPIKKRLFCTATPRHYNPLKQDTEGEAQIVFSMDRPEVYGQQAYRLSFGEAARREIICGYKIIISVITSEKVTKELLSQGEVSINGDAVAARQVANQIALRDAVAKYGVSKIFTFHNTVKSAASFVANGSEGIKTHLPEFGSYHISGMMTTARRESVMREFRQSPRAILSNARCLTEGVDVPAVDMVAFLSPRRSRIDIIQATGRAMRRSSGKSLGYILVPLYVEIASDESVEDAVSRSDFDEVWDVLQSLQEQDDVLAEYIRNFAEQKGRARGDSGSSFGDRVDFIGTEISLKNILDAVEARCLERLCSPWDIWFGKLKTYKEQFGDSNVQRSGDYAHLGSWLSWQRQYKKQGKLDSDHERRLNEVGMRWDVYDASWEEQFEELLQYKKVYGNCDVPRGAATTRQLGKWVSHQRTAKKRGKLVLDHEHRLNEVGFKWKVDYIGSWEEKFEELIQYKKLHGDCDVPSEWAENRQLANWVNTQRQHKKQGKLDSERELRLNEVGFGWIKNVIVSWEDRFEELLQYKKVYSNCDVPRGAATTRQLANWLNTQRLLKKQGKLDSERERLLTEAGCSWKIREVVSWEDRFEELIQYKKLHGDCDVPLQWTENRQLGTWVNSQRHLKKRGKLNSDHERLLNEAGFRWKIREVVSWEDRFEELVQYKKLHGDYDVPIAFPDNRVLSSWVHSQRKLKKKGKLDSERERLLSEAGFKWKHFDIVSWEDRFEELLQYKKLYGNCDVSKQWAENRQLANWVSRQRQYKKQAKLDSDRAHRLNEVGFKWEADNIVSWEYRFEELLQYKKLHNDCDVPLQWTENKQLGTWVNWQRHLKKRGKLNSNHERLLNEVGFRWKSKLVHRTI